MPFDSTISALNYDTHAFAQKRSAKELVKMLPKENIASFVDIGAGTGFVALEVQKRFPEAKITLLDRSDKMLRIAKSKIPDATIVNCDAENFDFAPQNFDLAIANLSVQWFKDFELFLKKILNYAKYFAFSVPLKGSFAEYMDIFNDVKIPHLHFYTQNEILHIVRANAEIVTTKRLLMTKTYPNVIEATRHFRNIGATMPITTETQSKISAVLKSHKAPITLCYDLFLCMTTNAY